jgi:stage II sporulation protein D
LLKASASRLGLPLALLLACGRTLPPPTSPPAATPETAVAPVAAPETAVAPVAAPAVEPVDPAAESATQPATSSGHRSAAVSSEASESSGSQASVPAISIDVPQRLRVGLATDLPAVEVPCCGVEVIGEAGQSPLAVVAAMRVEPDVAAGQAGAYRLQVAALKDERQALGLAERLAEMEGVDADVVFDAGSDLYRVRLGRHASREEAEAARQRLVSAGVESPFVISEAAVMAEPAMRLIQGDRVVRVVGRWLSFRPRGEDGVRIAGGRYRGRLLVYLNRRGTLNLINEVAFEDYLRGVVPREMGPEVFDDLDALKAQAVAARTYTLRNLGEFAGEGYDICATPRCQVYGGMDVEHPVSDRAVLETAGEVLVHGGDLVDARYSSTCGGHTEDMRVIFPQRDEPYLKGVPCLEAGVDGLAGDLARGQSFPDGLVRRLLPATGDPGPAALAARFEHLALLAGLPIPDDRLASMDRREVQRYVASLFDLALDARLFVAREDLPYLLDVRPPNWSESDLLLAAYLMRSGLLTGELEQPLAAAEIEETLFELAVFLRVLERRRVRYMSAVGGELQFRVDGELEALPLPARLATFRQRGERITSGPLSLLAGDRLFLYLAEGELVGVVQQVDPDGVAYDRTSNRSTWTRFRSDQELAKLAAARYPGLELESFEVISRGVSGRVGHLRLHGRDGSSVDVRGLAVRWTLDLPDTLFTAKRLQPPDRPSGWLFSGRGWGHGVGLCQVGAYGMGVRGHDYQEILGHYYSGVRVVRASTVPDHK